MEGRFEGVKEVGLQLGVLVDTTLGTPEGATVRGCEGNLEGTGVVGLNVGAVVDTALGRSEGEPLGVAVGENTK